MVSFTNKFAPLEPSKLRIFSGPLTPASPLIPLSYQPTSRTPPLASVKPLRPGCLPPSPPLQWLWSCHLCHQRYPLGATRRCLHDGHVFCSGVTVSKRTGTVKKRVACASEFDYVGWKSWSEWRQDARGGKPDNDGRNGCENSCTYPSECRWGKQLGTDSSPTGQRVETRSTTSSPASPPKSVKVRSPIFLEKLIESAEKKARKLKSSLPTLEEEEDEPSQLSTSPSVNSSILPGSGFTSASSGLYSLEEISGETDTDNADVQRNVLSDRRGVTLYDPPWSPKEWSTEPEKENMTQGAVAITGFFYSDLPPTFPSRRNAWDWDTGVLEGALRTDMGAGGKQLEWESGRLVDVELS